MAANPPPASRLRSWLWAMGAFLFGIGLYWYDDWSTTINEDVLFWVFGGFELLIMGPGMALLAYLVSEQLRLKDRRYHERLVQEREQRFRFLGRVAASMAHEIRNPLHNACLLTDEARTRLPEDARELLDRVNANLDRLDQATLLIYELAKPARRAEADSGPVDLPVLIEEILMDERALANDTVAVVHHRPAGSVTAFGRLAAFRIVVRNLVRNAIEAAGPRTVEIDYQLGAGQVEVLIRNPGRMPESLNSEEQEADSTKPGGMGIGIAIARHLTSLYGGRLMFTGDAKHVIAHLHLNLDG